MSNTRLTQYTHRPNTTELGMGNTHETYMLISKDTDLSSIFPHLVEVEVRDSNTGKHYSLKANEGREFRVNQMGEFYRDNNVLPGDEIVITKIEKGSINDICISVRHYPRVILIVGSNGTEIVNLDRLNAFSVADRKYNINIVDRGSHNLLEIIYKDSQKKRNDSPNTTDYYHVTINNKSLANGTYYLTLGNPSTIAMLPKGEFNVVSFNDTILNNLSLQKEINTEINSMYRPYITAIKSKPFLLLAGISGTGKSRIVRELARACWDADSEEFKAQKPKNFEMVQVKPNWHDSSELIGYVSRVSGQPVFVAGDFLKFVARAWEEPEVPYFLCLDEMNLAPVEQYFAEYLSVIESRKATNGEVGTDPILKPVYKKERDPKTGEIVPEDWYSELISTLLAGCSEEKVFALTKQFESDGISIPQNLIVVGTVNMDETTFSFSRKVLDRAMTIEMNEVDLSGGLTNRYEQIGKLGMNELVGKAVEGVDVYENYEGVCNIAITYLKSINDVLEGTPFKVAYRTRNEVLLYVVNNLPYNKNIEGEELHEEYVIARALDEITNMKVLSRIEGDETKVSNAFLEKLEKAIKQGLENIFEGPFEKEETDDAFKSVSLAKLDEMKKRLSSGYTSFWS